MSNIPKELKYASSHEWVRPEGDGVFTVGISDHAQELLGELVHVEVPEVDEEFAAGDEAATVESVKAASDVYAPIGGKIIEINEALEDEPELVNNDAYGDGWLFKIAASDASEVEGLLSAEDYQAAIEDE